MRRFRSLLSGVSAVAVMAALGSANPALAAATFSGPLTSPTIVNDQPDSYTINLDATVDKDSGANGSRSIGTGRTAKKPATSRAPSSNNNT